MKVGGVKAGEVSLKVPKLRTLPFETAIIERYKLSTTSGGRAAWKRP
jgi:transposase-like protein